MLVRISCFSLFSIFITFAFSFENKFIYHESGNENKIKLNHSPELNEVSEGYTRLTKLGEGHTTQAGMPELPQFTTYYQINPNKTYEFQFEVVDSYILENIKVLPHQSMDVWDVDNISFINNDVYNSFNSYPENNLIVSERSQGRGIEFVKISVIPYNYSPKNNRLEIYTEIEIHVVETGDNLDTQLAQPKRSHLFDEFYKGLIVNFQESSRPEDYQASSILYICGGNTISNSYVQQLIDWRHKQGYIVYAVSESEVGGSSASTSEIKNYIQNAYDNWENPPEIVGLIGDTGGSNSLPCYSHSWGMRYTGPTDFNYMQLDDSGDFFPDIFVGRISGGTSDIENIINKTIQYEKATYVDDVWFSKAGLLGDPDESGNSTIFTNQYIENLMINHGMNRIETDYDGSGTETFMEQQFNAGILYYNYRGWYYGSGSYPTNSINNGYKTPFVTTITCGTGDFDQTASSEQFVWLGSVNNPKGAVAAVGMATTGTHTCYNNIVNMGIYDAIFSKDLWYAGAANAYGDIAILATYPNPNSAVSAAEAFSKWSNLIGDPALHLWTGLPDDFNFMHPNEISLGTTTLDLTITNNSGDAVEGARVTLLMGDDIIFTTGLTDENGDITLNWDAVQSGTMSITVIDRNHKPYEGTIEIPDSFSAAVSLISDIAYLNAGEETDLEIELYNYGSLVAEDVIVELSSSSNQVTIYDGIENFGDIPSNTSSMKKIPLYIHGTAFDMEDLEFQITISDNKGNNWFNHVPVSILGSHLIITEYSGNINPGSQTEFSISIENEGSRSAQNLLVEILPYENLVTVNSGIVSIDNLSSGDLTVLNNFDLSFGSNIIYGSIVPLNVLFSSEDGFSRMKTINITVGEVRESDPLGPDPYGYYIYDSGDTDYDLAPEYEWIEIAQEENKLSISDSGNGNCSGNSYSCSSTVIDLPFVFTFYGEDYDQIVVNTNGWISFGNFEMYSFRNYPIPGAGGPSPMIAAFWDDLKTGSSGYVYHYQDDEMVVVQWDYMRTHDAGSRETFEIILYNKEYTSPTDTGDSEIKIQYEDFNNTSDGNYTGWTPYHGCYSTVGIENRMGDIGLQYTFNNTYSEAAATIEDGTALFITTRTESDFILGDYNEDGVLDVLDVVGLVNAVLGSGYSPSGDMNQDGTLDILDVVTLVNAILAP